MNDEKLALFIMLGQIASKEVARAPSVVPSDTLPLSPSYDLASLLPDVVRMARDASEGYRLFFVFERYIRELVVEVLSKDATEDWWDKIPKDVQDEVMKLEETEETKVWMALGSRDRSSLMTYPQLLRVIEHNWKEYFAELLRDKALLQQARLVSHLRNALCHMTFVPEEEMARIRQVIRDWFRVVAP